MHPCLSEVAVHPPPQGPLSDTTPSQRSAGVFTVMSSFTLASAELHQARPGLLCPRQGQRGLDGRLAQSPFSRCGPRCAFCPAELALGAFLQGMHL